MSGRRPEVRPPGPPGAIIDASLAGRRRRRCCPGDRRATGGADPGALKIYSRAQLKAAETPLFVAIRKAQHNEVKALLQKDPAQINKRVGAQGGAFPLLVACQEGQARCAAQLLHANADVNLAAKDGATALYLACVYGYSDCVGILLSQAALDCNRARSDGITPLFMACQRGHQQIVKELLGKGAAVDQQNNSQTAPLYIACQMGFAEIVAALLDAGADPDLATDNGTTPLYICAQEGHYSLVETLLIARADPHKASETGMTALYIAAQEDHTEIAALLLGAGAAVNQAEKGGAPPMLVACHQASLATVQLLSAHGSTREFPLAAPHDTAEHVAAHGRRRDIWEWLVESRHWCSALHHLDVISALRAANLLRGGADIDATSAPGGPTPLSLARVMHAAGHAPAGSAKRLILEAARPWNIDNHRLFPDEARARAVECVWTGHRLARRLLAGRSRAEVTVFLDVWRGCIVPRVVGRRGGGSSGGGGAARQPSSVERLTASEQKETPALGDGEEEATDEYSGDEHGADAAAAELEAEG